MLQSVNHTDARVADDAALCLNITAGAVPKSSGRQMRLGKLQEWSGTDKAVAQDVYDTTREDFPKG